MKRALTLLTLLLLAVPAVAGVVEDQYFDSGGVRIRYTVQGEGPPVVLVHGVVVNQDIQWRLPGIVDALAKDFKVIAIDNRGHGKSGKPHGAENYGAEFAHDIVRLLNHLEIERAHIVGYSLGGFITIKFITLYPDRVLTAIPSGAGWRQADDGSAELTEAIATSLEEGRGITPLIEALTPPGAPRPTAEEMAQTNAMVTGMNDVQALSSVFRSLEGLLVTEEQLKGNRVPTLAVIGANDPLKAGVDAMAAVMDNLAVEVIADTDHMDAFAAPRYVEIVREFMLSGGAAARDAGDLAVSRTN